MLSDRETLQLLDGVPTDDCLCAECDAAHARGFQAGLLAAGEPWVAVFFGVIGFLGGVLVATVYLSAHG